MTWAAWRKHGGCGLSHRAQSEVSEQLGAEASWGQRTLGELAAASTLAGREVARFAVEQLGAPELAVQEMR